MATEFEDDLGRKWLVALTTQSAKRIKAAVKVIDQNGNEVPFDLIDSSMIQVTMQVLRSKYGVVAETMWALVRPQCDAKGVTEEQFQEGMIGDALDRATTCIEEELVNFFPSGLRKVAAKMFRKSEEMRAQAYKEAEKEVDNLKIEELSGKESTKQPELSA